MQITCIYAIFVVLRPAPSPTGRVPSENTFASCGIYASLAFFACRSFVASDYREPSLPTYRGYP